MARFGIGDDELTSRKRKRRAVNINKSDTSEGKEPDDDSEEDDVGAEEGQGGWESSDYVGDIGSGSGGGGGGGVAVTIELDVLDCGVCYEPLSPPVFQCRNGHVACSVCCSKLGNKCPSCSETIGYSRCLALEKVIESIKIPCSNANYGCKQTFAYPQKEAHEETCIHAPCFCPIRDCSFSGSTRMLSAHFSRKNLDHFAESFSYNHPFQVSFEQSKPFLVLHAEDGFLFILFNRNEEPAGNAISVACIRSRNTVWHFSSELTASNKGNRLQMRASVANIQKKVADYRAKVFLLVPVNFFSCGKILLDVRIGKNRSADVNQPGF